MSCITCLAQINLPCGTPALVNPNYDPIAYRNALANLKKLPVSLPIRIHIIRQSNGSGGISYNNLPNQISISNSQYSGANFSLFECASFENIDNSSLYSFDYGVDDALLSSYNTPNVINIYYTNTIITPQGSVGGIGLFPWYPNPQDHYIIIAAGNHQDGTSLSHELGHFLGIYHTHEIAMGVEYVNGSNCSVAGDLICDTPADPNLQFCTNSSCQYTCPNLTDPLGDFYSPLTDNIMSYTYHSSFSGCGVNFTNDQESWININYNAFRTYLNCSSSGDDPCNATSLNVSTSCNFTNASNVGATNSTIQSSACDGPNMNGDVWFKATVPSSGNLNIETDAGTINDLGMAIYTGNSCSSLSFYGCYPNGSTYSTWMPAANLIGLSPGSTIWIRLWEYNNNNFGSFSICVFDANAGSTSLQYSDHNVLDDINGQGVGNGNGIAEEGEEIDLEVEIANTGASDAHNVSAILSTTSPYVTITDASENLPDISNGNFEWTNGDFDFDVSSPCISGNANFTLDISSDEGTWTDNFSVYLDCGGGGNIPVLSYLNNAVLDNINGQGVGNGNGLIESGEEIDLEVEIKNTGSGDAHNISASLSCSNPYITITDGNENFPDILAGSSEWTNSDFDFDINSPCVSGNVNFTIDISSDEGNWSDNFTLYLDCTVGAPPNCDFLLNDLIPVPYQTVNCIDQSINNPSSWNWSFTPNSFSFVSGNQFSSNPQVMFTATGTYTVSLQVQNAFGTDIETKVDYIEVKTCSNSINPISSYFTNIGGYGSFYVTDNNGTQCGWTAGNTPNWITVIYPTSTTTQNDSAIFFVDPCTGGGSRNGTITSAGQIHNVFQDCNTVETADFNQEYNILIYPSIASDILYIDNKSLNKIISIQILDISGRVMNQKFLPETNTNLTMNIEHLRGGIYFLRINSNESSYIKKFQKL